MTDSLQQERFLKLLRDAAGHFAAGQTAGALGALLDVREYGFVNKELDEIIEQLRDDASVHQVHEAADWVDEMLVRLQEFQGDAERLLEEMSEPVLGAPSDVWRPLDEGAVFDDSLLSMEISSFDDFGDLEGFDAMEGLGGLDDLHNDGLGQHPGSSGFDLWGGEESQPGVGAVEIVESLDIFDDAEELEQAADLDIFDQLDDSDAFVVPGDASAMGVPALLAGDVDADADVDGDVAVDGDAVEVDVDVAIDVEDDAVEDDAVEVDVDVAIDVEDDAVEDDAVEVDVDVANDVEKDAVEGDVVEVDVDVAIDVEDDAVEDDVEATVGVEEDAVEDDGDREDEDAADGDADALLLIDEVRAPDLLWGDSISDLLSDAPDEADAPPLQDAPDEADAPAMQDAPELQDGTAPQDARDASLRETALNPSISLWAAHQQTTRTNQFPTANSPAPAAPAGAPPAHDDDDFDFDFDLGLSTPGARESDLSSQADPPSPAQDLPEFDFDLDLQVPSAQVAANVFDDPAASATPAGLAGQSSHVDTDSGRWGKGFDFGLDDDDSFGEIAREFAPARGEQAPASRDESARPEARASFEGRASQEARRLEATPVGTPAVSHLALRGAEEPSAAHKTAQTPSLSEAKGHAAPRVEPVLDDDEFFELAESLSGKSPVPELFPQRTPAPKRYRGEPLMRRQRQATPLAQVPLVETAGMAAVPGRVREDTPNPFAHDEPTGVHNPLMHSNSSFVLEEISASELAEAQHTGDVMLQEARRFYEKGEFQTSRDLLLALIARDPSDVHASTLLATVEGELERSLRTRLGSMMKTPRLCIPMAAIASMNLDHRFGYLLSQIDGMITFEDILELSSMSRLETLDVLAQMLAKHIISLD